MGKIRKFFGLFACLFTIFLTASAFAATNVAAGFNTCNATGQRVYTSCGAGYTLQGNTCVEGCTNPGTITFNLMGGTGSVPQVSACSGQDLPALSNYTKPTKTEAGTTSFVLVGWFTGQNSGTMYYDADGNPVSSVNYPYNTSSLTLYAWWIQSSDLTKTQPSSNGCNASGSTPLSADAQQHCGYGVDCTTPAFASTPTCYGKAFVGWVLRVDVADNPPSSGNPRIFIPPNPTSGQQSYSQSTYRMPVEQVTQDWLNATIYAAYECPDGQIWNGSNACISTAGLCPTGQVWEPLTGRCICPDGQALNPMTGLCECPSDTVWDSELGQCASIGGAERYIIVRPNGATGGTCFGQSGSPAGFEKKFVLNIDTDGDGIFDSRNVSLDQSFWEDECPLTRDGYVHVGYALSSATTACDGLDSGDIIDSITLETGKYICAIWEPVNCTIANADTGTNTTTITNNAVTCAGNCNTGYYFDTATQTNYSVTGDWAQANVTGECSLAQYVVQLNAMGATNAGTQSVYPSYNTAMPSPITIPQKTGYNFDGYFANQGGTGKQYYDANGNAMVVSGSPVVWERASGGELYAKWTPKTYTVSFAFNPNNGETGTLPNPVTATYGEVLPTLTSFTAPQREHYSFAGWYTNIGPSYYNYYDKYGVGSRVWDIDADTTLTPNWSNVRFTINYHNDGATGGDVPTTPSWCYSGRTCTLGGAGTLYKTGKVFAGWRNNYTGAEYTATQSVSFGAADSANGTTIELYPIWDDQTCTVLLNTNGGTGRPAMPASGVVVDSSNYTYSCLVGVSDPAVGCVTVSNGEMGKSGYLFTGWNTAADGSGTSYAVSDAITCGTDNTLTLYAQWSAVNCTYTNAAQKTAPTINTTANTATCYAQCNLGYNTDGGLFTDATARIDASVTGTYAQTQIEVECLPGKYNITLNANGGTANQTTTTSATATYLGGLTPTSITAPQKTNYAFDGYWDTAAETGGNQYYNRNGQYITSKTWNTTNHGELWARWTSQTITVTCPAGEYIAQGTTTCTKCEPGNYCEGITEEIPTTGATTDLGQTDCGKYNGTDLSSDAGAKSRMECYIPCTQNCINTGCPTDATGCTYETKSPTGGGQYCVDDNCSGLGNCTATAQTCAALTVTCPSKKYYNAASASCTSCTTPYYCPGGTYTIGTTAGNNSCNTGYATTVNEASTTSQCLKSCTVECTSPTCPANASCNIATGVTKTGTQNQVDQQCSQGAFACDMTVTCDTGYTYTDGVCEPNEYTVRLNAGNGATAGAPATLYLVYNTGWYTNANHTTSFTVLTTPPTHSDQNNYQFRGYYTGQNGAGTKVIGTDYKPATTRLTGNSPIDIYAYWVQVGASCDEGTYYSGTGTTCLPCPEDYYCPGISYEIGGGEGGKYQCQNGSQTNGTGKISYTECFVDCASTGCNNNTAACPSGATGCTYANPVTNSGIKYCANDTCTSFGACSATTPTCQPTTVTCPVGTYYNATSNKCDICPKGSYCKGGTFELTDGTQGKQDCPDGMTTAQTGQSSGTACYGDCTKNCTENGYESCPAGTNCQYNENYQAPGTKRCNDANCQSITCDATGKCPILGTACEEGYYGTTSCTPCENGFTSPAGSTSATACTKSCEMPCVVAECPANSTGCTPDTSVSSGVNDGTMNQVNLVCTGGTVVTCPFKVSCADGYEPANNGTATASCEPKNLTVKFNPNGGTLNGGPAELTLRYNTGWFNAGTQVYNLNPLPARDYFAFAGYWTADVGGDKIIDKNGILNNTTFTTTGATLYAHWEQEGGNCDPGTYYPGTGTECLPCDEDNYCPGGEFTVGGEIIGIVPCPDGFTTNGVTGAVNGLACKGGICPLKCVYSSTYDCPANATCNHNQNYTTNGTWNCANANCSAYTECQGTPVSCPVVGGFTCNANYYQNGQLCTKCADGFTSPAGSTSMSQCVGNCVKGCKVVACPEHSVSCDIDEEFTTSESNGTWNQFEQNCSGAQVTCPVVVGTLVCEAGYTPSADGQTCETDVFTITLNSNKPTDSVMEMDGMPSPVYQRYTVGWYNNKTDAVAGITPTLTRLLLLPKAKGYDFQGYYTADTNPIRVIGEDGVFKYPDLTQNQTVYAEWKNGTLECAATTYYPGTGTECLPCPENSYCPGITDAKVNNEIPQGINSCPDGGVAPAESFQITQCYKTKLDYTADHGSGTQTCYYDTNTMNYADSANCKDILIKKCDAGYYRPTAASVDCYPVNYNFYSPADDLERYACPPDGITSGITSASVTECYVPNVECRKNNGGVGIHAECHWDGGADSGAYTDCGVCVLNNCNPGYKIVTSSVDNVMNYECEECDAGNYCTGGQEILCPAPHSMSDAGSDSVADCYTNCPAVENAASVAGRVYSDGAHTCQTICEARYELVANTDPYQVTCETCEEGYVCPGGNNKTSCTVLTGEYAHTDGGAASADECYNFCPTVANATSNEGKLYADGTGSCETICADGFELVIDAETGRVTCEICAPNNVCMGGEKIACLTATNTTRYMYSDAGTYDMAGCYANCENAENAAHMTGRDYYDGKNTCEIVNCNPGYVLQNGQCVPCPANHVCSGIGPEVPCTDLTGGQYTKSAVGTSDVAMCYRDCALAENAETMAGADYYTATDTCEINTCKVDFEIYQERCAPTKCPPHQELVDHECIPCSYDLNALTYLQDGNCMVDICKPGYHAEGLYCVGNDTECTAPHATVAIRKWNSGADDYGVCIIQECEDGYHIESNTCVSNTATCDIENGTGIKTWDVVAGAWGLCEVTECEAGFTNDPYLTNERLKQCGHCKNKFTDQGELSASSYVRECEIATCMYQGEKYALEDNQCVLICKDGFEDETGTMRWNASRGRCERTCKAGFTTW